jgi:hypothetical protein
VPDASYYLGFNFIILLVTAVVLIILLSKTIKLTRNVELLNELVDQILRFSEVIQSGRSVNKVE